MSETKKAIATIGTVLKWGTTSAAVTSTVPIKSFPDLGGSPEMIEVTDLEDAMQAFVLGVQASGAMEFTANFTKARFETVNTDARKDMYYELAFGSEATFAWQGQHSVHVTGGGVNEPVEMVITIAPTTKPALKTKTT